MRLFLVRGPTGSFQQLCFVTYIISWTFGFRMESVSDGPPRWCNGKESTCQCRRFKRYRFDSWVRKIPERREMPWRRKWQPTLVFLPGKTHGQRRWVGYSPWCCKESVRHDLATKPQPPCSAFPPFLPSIPWVSLFYFLSAITFKKKKKNNTPSHLLFTYRTMGKQPLEMRRENYIFFDPVTTEVAMLFFFFSFSFL